MANEDSEIENNSITFAHSFRVPITEVRHMMPKQFATVHKYSFVNWNIQISQSRGIPAIIRNMLEPENRDATYQVTLNNAGQREKYPPVQSVEFKIRLIDNQDKDIVTPIRFVHPPGFPARNLFNLGYSTPENGPVKEFFNSIIGNKNFEHLQFEVQTLIVFDVKTFVSMKYFNESIGKPMPIDLNFRYNLLTNQSTHNFFLKTTTEQSFPCNKEAIFVASPFFRKNLTCEMTCFQLGVEFIEAVEIVITWLLTETYHPPLKMTPELADETVKLSDRILPRGSRKPLCGSIERHCFDELIQNFDDMLYVKHLLLVAHNNQLGSLLEACHATIISYHVADFYRDLKQNANPAFTVQTQMNRSSALGRFNANYTKSLYVKSYTRKAEVLPQSN